MRMQNATSDYEFSSVDRLFVSQRLPLQKCVADVFKNEVHKMDFVVDPELARMYINNWVANQTNGHIKDLVPSSKISYNTRLVLVRKKKKIAPNSGVTEGPQTQRREKRGEYDNFGPLCNNP